WRGRPIVYPSDERAARRGIGAGLLSPGRGGASTLHRTSGARPGQSERTDARGGIAVPAYEAFYKGRDVMITGGLGFIGSNLAIRLVELGARVTLVDSLIPEYGGNLHNVAPVRERVTINIADVRDEYSMNYLVQGREIIFNL